MNEFVLIALMAPIFGCVWSLILTQPGELFGWWPALVYSITRNEQVNKLLYGCEKCIAGQFALWAGLYYYFFLPLPYSVIYHACSVVCSIFIAAIIGKLWQY